MISGRWLRIAPLESSTPLQTMSYWIGLDRQRILGLQRLEPALRHRERVVAELDLAGVRVALEHREVDDPAEAERPWLDQAELVAEPACAPRRRTSRPRAFLSQTKNTASPSLERRPPRAMLAIRAGVEVLGDRALGAALGEDDVAEARRALLARPVVQLVEEAARLARRRPAPGSRARSPPGGDRLGEDAEAASRGRSRVTSAMTSGLRRSGLSVP